MKILAVDLGDARTGIACCDKMEFMASPVCVVHEKEYDKILEKVAQIAKEQGAEQIVVGHPKNMNNTIGERALKCQEFAKQLGELTQIETVLWDERGTTVSATGFLNLTDTRGKKRKNVIDVVAATIILENYMNYRKNTKLNETK